VRRPGCGAHPWKSVPSYATVSRYVGTADL